LTKVLTPGPLHRVDDESHFDGLQAKPAADL